jgi:hypothetical protein
MTKSIALARMTLSKDVAALIQRIIDEAADHDEIVIPNGLWKLTSPLEIIGKCVHLTGGRNTQLATYHDRPALIVKRNGFSIADIEISNIWFANRQNPAMPHGTGNHGLDINTRVHLNKLIIEGYFGNGINMIASANQPETPSADVSHSLIENIQIGGGQGDGIFIAGGDANAVEIRHCDIRDLDGYGIHDYSFLGSNINNCMVHACKKGAYHTPTDGYNNRTVFLGCYAEGGQPVSEVGGETQIFGGLWSGGVVLHHLAKSDWNGEGPDIAIKSVKKAAVPVDKSKQAYLKNLDKYLNNGKSTS